MEIEKKDMVKVFLKKLSEKKEEGLTYAKLAEIMGISERQTRDYINASLGSIKKEIGLPKVEVLAKLSKKYSVPIEFWLYDEKDNELDLYILTKQLGAMIRHLNVDISVTGNNTIDDVREISLKIADEKFAKTILELFRCKEFKNFDKVVSRLAESYKGTEIYNKKLVTYGEFETYVRHEYIFQTVEEGTVFEGKNAEGNLAIAADEYTLDEIDNLATEWEQFSYEQKKNWYNMNGDERYELLGLSLEEKLEKLSKDKSEEEEKAKTKVSTKKSTKKSTSKKDSKSQPKKKSSKKVSEE